jgi:hypothetical protein
VYFTNQETLGCEKNRHIFFVTDISKVNFSQPSKKKIKKKIKNCF